MLWLQNKNKKTPKQYKLNFIFCDTVLYQIIKKPFLSDTSCVLTITCPLAFHLAPPPGRKIVIAILLDITKQQKKLMNE